MEKWANQAHLEPTEYRDIALQRIIDCLKNKSIFLDLSGLGLTSLPDHLPNNIRFLDIYSNQLTQLPSTLPNALKVWLQVIIN